MGDDGYVGVNLGFAFPFYDKIFDKAYMYDNGVVSFIAPGQPNALSPWQWSAQPLQYTQAKYFIAPLWADMAPVQGTTYTLTGTATTQKFAWHNLAEYYSIGGGLRLNSFSVEIDANGNIAAKYFGLNLRTSNITIGYKGDTEYTQLAYYPSGTVFNSFQDWTFTRAPSPTPSPTPTTVQQEPVTTIEQTLAITAPVTVQETQQTTSSAPATTTTTTTTTAAATAPTVVAPTPVASSSNAPISIAAEPTKTEQKKPAVKAQSSSDNAESSVLATALAVASNSAAMSVSSQNQVTTSTVAISQDTTAIFNKQAGASSSSSMADAGSTTGQAQQMSSSQTTSTVGELKNPLDMFVMGFMVTPEIKQEVKDKPLNRAAAPIAELGQGIPGFNAYASLTIPDSAFYKPKEIYRSQRVVDNNRLLRSLTSDGRYEQMINQQYQR